MVDVVALVVNLLRDAGHNWYADLPAGVTRPVGRIEEAGGPPQPSSQMPNRLTRVDLQLTAWAETKTAARQLLDTAITLLHDTPRTDPVNTEGTLTRVEPLGMFYLPDEEWPVDGRPGPRYEMTVRTVAHG